MNIKKQLKKIAFLRIAIRTIKSKVSHFRYNDHQFKVKTYETKHGRTPNLVNPKAYSEKMLWSSENYRDDRFVEYADKFLVRKHIKEVIGEEYLIPLYDVVDKAEDLKFDKYPVRFVLNATHGSNMVLLCKDKSKFNRKSASIEVKYWLRTNYYHEKREWHYNYIKPRVLVMENISSPDGTPPWDYKFFCFNGKPEIVALDLDRFGDVAKRNLYDMEWNQIKNVSITRPQDYSREYPKPQNFEKMVELATVLCQGFEHIRVDFYNVNGKIYFGELTFLHAAAGINGNITPWEFDLKLGENYQLPERNIDTWKYKGSI